LITYNFDAIPEILKNERRWVLWKQETTEKGRPTKVPYYDYISHYDNSGHIAKASSKDPRTWSSFDDIVSRYTNKYAEFDGIGFMLGQSLTYPDKNFCGIDYDNHFIGGMATPFLNSSTEMIDSYTELSPSGEGVHTICIATKPATLVKAYQDTNYDGTEQSVEIYDNRRYFTMTGVSTRIDGGMQDVSLRQTELEMFYKQLFPLEPSRQASTQQTSTTHSESEIIEIALRATNKAKFEKLWIGDCIGYESHSEADLAFCNMLAFYTGKDVSVMDSLFRKSGLMRNKWDRKTGDTTYGAITLQKAIAYTKEVYEARKSIVPFKTFKSIGSLSNSSA